MAKENYRGKLEAISLALVGKVGGILMLSSDTLNS